MPRTFSQTVNAAQMLSITPTVDLAAGTMTVASRYVVGSYDGASATFSLIKGAANGASASVNVPLSTTLADANMQLQLAIAEQEGLDITQSVQSVTVIAGGTGYGAPAVTFSAPQMPGTTAAGTVDQAGGVVTTVTLSDPGSGYLAPPLVTFADSTGTGAVASAVMLVGDRVLAPV